MRFGLGCLFTPSACLIVNSAHEQIQPGANQEHQSRDNCCGKHDFMMPRQIRLQRGRKQPHLHDEQQRDERQRAVKRGQPAFLSWLALLVRAHVSFPISIPTATMSLPRRSSSTRGSGRGGGPCSTSPLCTEK